MTLIPLPLFAGIVGIALLLSWGMTIAALPFAVRSHKTAEWLREASIILYMSAIAIVCVIVRSALP